jgi:deazaflavin-dependent oxidoreductase (nitroreductase family)
MGFDTPAGTRGARTRSSAGPFGHWMQRRMMNYHRRAGWKFLGMEVLFLTTVGRRTGAERTTAVSWFPYGDGTWLIVASAAGAAQHPAWYKNLAAHPDQLSIELADGRHEVIAEQLSSPSREQIWLRIIAAQPRYAKYQNKTDRELPVIHLMPRGPAVR